MSKRMGRKERRIVQREKRKKGPSQKATIATIKQLCIFNSCLTIPTVATLIKLLFQLKIASQLFIKR